MSNNAKNISGYLTSHDYDYMFSTNGHIITLLPAIAQGSEIGIHDVLTHLEKIEDNSFLYGTDSTYHSIAFWHYKRPYYPIISRDYSFHSPLIIQSTGNASGFFDSLTADWNKFRAITFKGDILNAVYNPKLYAMDFKDSEDRLSSGNFDGARTIKIKPYNDYTYSIDAIIDNSPVKIAFSVAQSGEDSDMNSASLGSLQSFVRIVFEDDQDFSSVPRIIELVNKLFSIFVKGKDNLYDITLSQLTQGNKYQNSAKCVLAPQYDNYSKVKGYQVVPFDIFNTHLPKMIELVSKDEANTLLALLPDSDKTRNFVTLTHIQDVCTALECEYSEISITNPTTKLLSEFKTDIKKAVKKFRNMHPYLDVYTNTTINSVFKNLDLTLHTKIKFLYEQNRKPVDNVIGKWKLPPLSDENLKQFVQFRNDRIHTGVIDWKNNNEIYISLFALTYACFLRRSGFSEEEITNSLERIF